MAAALAWRFNGTNGGSHGGADLVGLLSDSCGSQLVDWWPVAFSCSSDEIVFSCCLKGIGCFV